MGKGIDLARELGNTEHADVLEHFKEQLLIVMLKRLGGKLEVPLKEMDDTGGDMMALALDPDTKIFHFTIVKKQ